MKSDLSDACRGLSFFLWDSLEIFALGVVDGQAAAGASLGLHASAGQSAWVSVATEPLGPGSTIPE